MFEKRLKEISDKLSTSATKEFFIVTHKKHRREIYFQNTKKAVNFMRNKFNSPLKKFVYFLIKLGLLQLFLKKIKLSDKFGDLIFVAGQVKSFDLKEKVVYSFPVKNDRKGFFMEKIAKRRLAPDIIEINEKIPYSKEELLKEYGDERDIEAFKKLYSFYKSSGIKRNSLKEYVKTLINGMGKKGFKNEYLMNILKKLLKVDKKILTTTLHGDFAKENILINKKDETIFVDWEPNEGVITGDLINFFRGEENLLENKKFLKILREIFPKKVQKNIKLYIVLSEISSIVKAGRVHSLYMNRIKKYSSFLFPPKNQTTKIEKLAK